MGAKTQLTVENLERLPETGDVSYGLDQGELVEVSSAGYLHNRIRGRVERFLGMQLDNHPEQGEVVAEQWFRLNDDTVRAPDVALIAPSQLPLLEPEHRIQPFSPALAVEITSPPNTFDELARKTQQYLEAGTSAVSILVTATHEILVYRAGAHTTILTAPDLLEDTALLPGFSDPVEELFAV